MLSEYCAPEISELGEGVVYGVYRLLERLGNAAGPMIAATLALHFDYRTGFIAIGAGVCACGILFFLFSARSPKRVLRPVPLTT